ncbi:major facilitator superfamily [Methanocaldococcus bathoardescens]|uniref:Major facilitator superfamily n=1 Tax=Methanocaldococcus bathoardescens TaxID=1301915 RepID=A0A076L9H1_9EURY|nr:MFS transporter [Methanocaldococcus bathoardescens]AIJ04965.1 major facilitator superfamily [Methanocaldococcus bathoardescens]
MGKLEKNVFVIWITTFTTMLGVGLIAPIMAIYAQTLGATNLEIGLIFGSFALARTVAQIPVGVLSDIYGKKFFIVCGTFFYGVFTLLYNFVSTVLGLLIVRTFTGIFSSFVTPVAGSYVAAIAPKTRLGEYMGIFNSAITLGFGVGPFIGGILADIYGIRTPFYFCGFLGILAAIISYMKLEDIVFNENTKKRSIKNISNLFSFEFLKNRNFLSSFVINTSNVMINAGIITYLALYAISYDISISQVGFMIASTNILIALLQRSFGKLYDRLGNVMIIIGIFIISFGMYLLSTSTTFLNMIISLTIVAVGSSISSTATTSLAVKDIPTYRKGEAMGLFTTSMNIGMFIGSISFGFLADILGIANMYKFSAIFSIVVGIISYLRIER